MPSKHHTVHHFAHPPGAGDQTSIAALRQQRVSELMTLFKTLPAPSLSEMHGEYAAQLLGATSMLGGLVANLSVNNPLMPGQWLCKAFRSVSDTEGRGYNTFRHFGRIVQRFPMQTLIAPSRYDGKPAFTLVYRAYKSMCGTVHMVDEVRRLRPGVYLGIGTYGFTDTQRRVPNPFLLVGPEHSYRTDIGTSRGPFDLAREVPALRRP